MGPWGAQCLTDPSRRQAAARIQAANAHQSPLAIWRLRSLSPWGAQCLIDPSRRQAAAQNQPAEKPTCLSTAVRRLAASFIDSFFHSLIQSFIHSTIHSFNDSRIHSTIHSIIHSTIQPFIQLFIQPFNQSFIHCSFFLSLVHSFFRSFFFFLSIRPSPTILLTPGDYRSAVVSAGPRPI